MDPELVILHRPLPVRDNFFPSRSFFSSKRTLAPFSAARAGYSENIPEGPPPTTMTSYFFSIAYKFYLTLT